MSTDIVIIFVHQYVKFLTIPLTFPFNHMGFFKDFCEGSVPFPLCMRNSVQSHLRHAKRAMAIWGGEGSVFEQWPFSVEEVGFLL